ncbi:helix-turn-helix domain-containing protein [Candidatus Woesearchaeota archaeon]|nr:helix-turn-helix domain-containing protein [Candidatus Woesearchaeota archaeon]
MWIVKLKIKHNCTIGNRCKKFECISFSLSLNSWYEKNSYYISQRHTIEGNKENVDRFLKDLKKDKRIINLEMSKNTVFFIEKRKKGGIPSSYYNPRMFFVKPIFVDRKGVEYWEMAAWKKEVLMKFVSGLKSEKDIKLTLEKFQNVKLDTIYFPKIMPKLSEKQKEAYQLAVEEGYYTFPRKSDLGDLAKLMKVSVSTFQEHLRKAEEKIMPSYV